MGRLKDGSDISEGSEGKEGSDSREFAPYSYQPADLAYPKQMENQTVVGQDFYKAVTVGNPNQTLNVFRF